MMKQTLRITFTGDVMCGSKQDIVAHRYGNDYSGMFSLVRECFSKSGYVVGNLETVFAGERLRSAQIGEGGICVVTKCAGYHEW